MFSKVLIANRGAIATRIIRTLAKMNIASLAIYAEADADSLHVSMADEAVCLGSGGATDTYLNSEKILAIAKEYRADAVHPGYGFLSENADFVALCEASGIAFIGPTAEHIKLFGLKHQARELAANAGIPLTPGSNLLNDLPSAQQAASAMGYPVMLKSTAGGGGIGLQLCNNAADLENAFTSVKRLSANNFANDGVFIEKFIARARHIEVQIFADGKGSAIAIGERDCSAQRRNQKVIEECPAPGLEKAVREKLQQMSETLLSAVNYRNAATVEFIYDVDSNAFYFLEVNTRLQVEHGVTEQVYGIDLVQWMVQLAAQQPLNLAEIKAGLTATGHAIQARIYAEDPYQDFRPSADGLIQVEFPQDEGIRIDHWISAGVEVPAYFDPMLAKVIVQAESRQAALTKLQTSLTATKIYGVETNISYLQALLNDSQLINAQITTGYLNEFEFTPARIDVLQGGTQTTIQDYPARTGYWHVGVPPSGPFDSHSFRLANRLLNNPEAAAGLEMTIQGPTLKFSCATQIVLAGAEMTAQLDQMAVPFWQVIDVAAGQVLTLGRVKSNGNRCYLAVRGGIQCPAYLGSKSTFTLGEFGGHNGRTLRTGDVLHLDSSTTTTTQARLSKSLRPELSDQVSLRVIYGPHGAPDFFTQDDITTFFQSEWKVHYNSSRSGIRLIGPKPKWARADGGEAGLHPSNIHDNAYAFGTVDFTGDMPVILGPDGPSLGGFVCPATVISADLWKLGQLKADDRVRFIPVSLEDAVAIEAAQRTSLEHLSPQSISWQPTKIDSPILARLNADEVKLDVVYRAAGNNFLLIEYGDQVLDISLRFRAHALMRWLQQNPIAGIAELTPGIRSLQVHYDSQKLQHKTLLQHLQQGERYIANHLEELSVPSRILHIPLSWDDEVCQQAIEKYQQSVRKNAPWCPSNLEFIKRINGLDSIAAVKDILFKASWLVMGLGDVYLGAPVATPLDPRHRLVTTKYNPARTWTAENSVGIGGSYLCVYGLEGPGGYQFVGRTLQMWNRYRKTKEFQQPWLLQFFDQIRFYEVSAEELLEIRQNFVQGRYPLKIEHTEFCLTEYQDFLNSNATSINAFREQREQAFAEELAQWHAKGQFHFDEPETIPTTTTHDWPEEHLVLDSPVSGSVWKIAVQPGQQVKAGDLLLILESMKMEIPIQAHASGTVTQVLLETGQSLSTGQALVVIDPNA